MIKSYFLTVSKARIVLFVLLFVIGGMTLKAQHLSFREADSLSYQYYLAGKWDEVLNTGNQAIASGNDYFYLRMRMGIAAFEKENYVLAGRQFREALRYNPYDLDAYKYLVAGRLQRNQLSLAGAETIGQRYFLVKQLFPKTGIQLQSAHFDYGFQQFSQDENNFEKLSGPDGFYGTESVPQNRSFFDGGMKFQTKPNFFVYVGFQSLDIPFIDRFAYVESNLEIDSIAPQYWGKEFYYRLDSTRKIQEFERTIKQNVLYTQLDWAPSAHVQLILSGQLILINQQMNYLVYEPVTLRDTTYIVDATGETGFVDVETDEARFGTFAANSTEWSLYAGVVYDAGYVSVLGGVAASRINKQQIWQLNAGLSYYPFGNLNLYSSSELSLLRNGNSNNLIFKQTLGFRPIKQLWLEGIVHAGNQSFYSDQTSYIVYNSTENVQLRAGLNAYVMLGSHLSFQLRYAYTNGERLYSTYLPTTEETQTNYTSFQSTRITGGIKWTF